VKIVALAPAKGGVGKTTLTAALATAAALDLPDTRVGVVDLDPQGSLTHWWNHRRQDRPLFYDLAGASLAEAMPGLRAAEFELLFADCPPGFSDILRETIEAAYLALVPAQASALDRAAIESTVEMCERAGIPHRTVLSRAIFRSRIAGGAVQLLRERGHPVGDGLLRQVAERLSSCVRQLDTVARFGGDEFGVVQVGPDRVEDVATLAQRIIDVLSRPYEVDGYQVIIGVSLGIAMACTDGSDPDTLLKNADIALYRAKAEGRGVYRFFAPEMDVRLQQRRKLELELHAALLNGEFELYYQPQLDLATERICGFDALMRWNHPTRGLVNPYEFIWLTEEMGLIVPLGEWALRQACREAMLWPYDVRVAVNLSPVQFNRHDLVRSVTKALADSGLPAQRLDLEITESVLLMHNAENLDILREMRALGVRISMDDFGTGYSSLSYLRSFPFDKIKIDQSFIRDLPHDKDAVAIVRAITALGTSLGMVTVAEGVERPDQLTRLRDEGCVEVQGYLFSVPQPASEIPGLLRRFHSGEPRAPLSPTRRELEPAPT
jgi:predicted signal transduction protein with EAL and GGDEF domain